VTAKWKRDIQVIAGPLTIEPRTEEGENQPMLKMRFDITKTNNREANSAELAIWNLKEESRTLLQPKGLEVIIKAGYVDSIAQIFKADSSRTVNSKELTDWITTIEFEVKELKSKRINKSLRGPQKAGTILQEAADALGLDIGNVKDQIRSDGARSVLKEFVSGVVLSGKASDVMDEVASSLGLNYSVQDKKLQVLPKNGVLPGPAIDLSVETGMIGSPQIGEKGTVTTATLLDPRMVPGRRVKLDSLVVSGEFKVQKVHHVGDTWGAEWTSELEMDPL
jgi:hypothetical protein